MTTVKAKHTNTFWGFFWCVYSSSLLSQYLLWATMHRIINSVPRHTAAAPIHRTETQITSTKTQWISTKQSKQMCNLTKYLKLCPCFLKHILGFLYKCYSYKSYYKCCMYRQRGRMCVLTGCLSSKSIIWHVVRSHQITLSSWIVFSLDVMFSASVKCVLSFCVLIKVQ